MLNNNVKVWKDIHLSVWAGRGPPRQGSHFSDQFEITGQHLYMHQLEPPRTSWIRTRMELLSLKWTTGRLSRPLESKADLWKVNRQLESKMAYLKVKGTTGKYTPTEK